MPCHAPTEPHRRQRQDEPIGRHDANGATPPKIDQHGFAWTAIRMRMRHDEAGQHEEPRQGDRGPSIVPTQAEHQRQMRQRHGERRHEAADI